MAEHGDVYRTRDGGENDIIDDLENYPLRNGRGEDLPIFDGDGNSIRRTSACPVPGAQPAGMFLALDQANDLFRSGFLPIDREQYAHSNKVDKYPIAHLQSVGCIQTRQPLPLFHPIIKRINDTIGEAVPYEDGDEPLYEDVDEEGNPIPPAGIKKQPIFGTHTQIYNLSTHHFAPHANEYRVLHGQVTAAATSVFAMTSSDRRRGQVAVDKIAVHLPFEALEAQIDGVEIPVSMRLEQVFVVSFDDMDEEYKTGM